MKSIGLIIPRKLKVVSSMLFSRLLKVRVAPDDCIFTGYVTICVSLSLFLFYQRRGVTHLLLSSAPANCPVKAIV